MNNGTSAVVPATGESTRGWIQPRDIDLSSGLSMIFENPRHARAATNLVRFFQIGNEWGAFSIKKLAEFYEDGDSPPKGMLAGLTKASRPYVILQGKDFIPTRLFLSRLAAVRIEQIESDA
jgi:hypothetical protein